MEYNFILIVLFVWVLALTVVTFWILRFFRLLSREVDKGSLTRILEKVLETETKNSEDIKLVEKKLKFIEGEVLDHIQKVGLVRFNPFGELGGDHSFVISFLDGRSNGVVITVLHTRDRTRIYAKSIIKGKSRFELSKEETKSLLMAMNKK